VISFSIQFLDISHQLKKLLIFVPFLLMVFVFIRNFYRMDELEKQIQTNAMAVGFVATIISSMVVSFFFTEGIDMRTLWIICTLGLLASAITAIIQRFHFKEYSK